MSKVVHLSQSAHEQAKAFCTRRGLSMSDWVAALIAQATAGSGADLPTAQAADQPSESTRAPKRALRAPTKLKRDAKPTKSPWVDTVQKRPSPPEAPRPPSHWFDEENDESAQVYTAPPFWDRERHTGAPMGNDAPTAH